MESPRVTNKQDTSFISSVHEDLASLGFPGKVTNNTQAAGKQLLLQSVMEALMSIWKIRAVLEASRPGPQSRIQCRRHSNTHLRAGRHPHSVLVCLRLIFQLPTLASRMQW